MLNKKIQQEKTKSKFKRWLDRCWEKINDTYFFKIVEHKATYFCLLVSSIIGVIFISMSFSKNYDTKVIGIIILCLPIILTIVMVGIIFGIVKGLAQMEYRKKDTMCQQCTGDASKYQFANFDFVTFDTLINIEKSMSLDEHPEKCTIYVYTSDISTEEDAEETVKMNRENGVTYKIYYTNGKPTSSQSDLYGCENLIKCNASSLDSAADFDIMIYVDSNHNKNGFFCVNFSKTHGPRPCSQGYVCANECHYQNENLLYKKIREDTVELILNSLNNMEVENHNE